MKMKGYGNIYFSGGEFLAGNISINPIEQNIYVEIKTDSSKEYLMLFQSIKYIEWNNDHEE